MSVSEALERPVTDVSSLEFIARVARLGTSDLRRAAAAPVDAARLDRVIAALNADCPGPAAPVVATRAYVLAGSRTHGGTLDLSESARSSLFGDLANAAAALAVRRRLSDADVDAMLAPFGITAASLTVIQPALSVTCSQPDVDAAVVDKVEPTFPAAASAAGETGVVYVHVLLDEFGLVQNVQLYDLKGVRNGSSLITASLFAAAASTFQPAIHACKTAPNTYLFVSEFDIP